MNKFFTLLTLCFLSVAVLAEKQVSGIVVDEKSEPVIGASIQVDGTTIGTISDFDGEFELIVPDDATTVTVSFIGMKEQKVKIQKVMRVVMVEAAQELEDVVVTGYGNVSKGSFAGSAQAVSAENIEKKNASEISKALANEVAGVQVISSTGQPGTNASIVIRGIGSVNGSSAPLYVVDGVAYDGDISAIDPGDIASTTILKDATATSLYGSRGANGVIIITTKKGNSNEEGVIDVDVRYGGNMRLLPLYETITSPEDYVTMAWQSIYNQYRWVNGMPEDKAIKAANNSLYSGALPAYYNIWDADGKLLINPYDNMYYVNPSFDTSVKRRAGYENLESWRDAIFRVGNQAEASVKIHGGTDKLTYFTSFGYLKDEGYYRASDFDRFNVRSNLDYQPKKWLKANLNLAYSYTNFNSPDQDGDGAMNNGFFFLNAIPAIYPVYQRNPDGTIATDPRTGGPAFDYGDTDLAGNSIGRKFGMGINPAGAVLVDKENQKQHEVDAKGSFEFKLYDGLKATVNIGVHYLNNVASQLTNKWYGDAAGLGRIYQSSSNNLSIFAQQLIEYNKVFGDHTVRVLGGHETQFYIASGQYGYKSNLASGSSLLLGNAVKISDASGSSNQFTMDSYVASATYMYKERYGITGNYRADGSSRYAPGHRWGHFGSVGASWNWTDEDFVHDNVEWLKNGKLRLSWGVLGNQMNSLYSYVDLYTIENVGDEIAYIWTQKGNPDITWERTMQTDLGLEVSFDKYVDLEIDYFHKLTDRMLFYRYVSPSLGYSAIPSNDAKMVNQGVELTLNVHAVDTRNVKLDIRFNGANYNNKMKEMPIDYYDAQGNPVRMVMSGAMSEGHSMYDIYMPVACGVDEKGNALFEAWYDTRYGGLGDNYLTEEGSTGYNYIPSLHIYRESEIQKYKQQHPNASDTEARDYINSVLAMKESPDATYATSRYTGKSYLPDWEGGLGINLEVYGVTLDVACGYRIGGYGYDNTYALLMSNEEVGKRNWHVDIRNSWTENNTNTDIPALTNGQGDYAAGANATPSTRFLISNSYFALNSIQLGYNIPKKALEKIKLKRLNLYVSATNLAVATARKGYIPTMSISGGGDVSSYTPLSTICGGIKLSF